MNVFIIGIGLIGGSFAKDLRRINPDTKIYGIDANEAHLEEAISLNLIDAKSGYDNLGVADMVIVSIPVDVLVTELPKILDEVNDECVVFDGGSTKNLICKSLEDHPKRKTNIICEVEKTAFKLQERALDLFQKMGMRIRYMNPEAHDKHIAYVSHLSHISSFMLGKTVIEKEKNERDIFDMAGSGFESTVRLAKSSPAMWTPIFEQNKVNVVETLDEYIQNLEEFKQMLLRNDYQGIYDQMNNANKIKEILNGIPLNKK